MSVSCSVCGTALEPAGSACICFERQDRPHVAPAAKNGGFRRAFTTWVLLPFLFMATCTALVPPSARLTGPLTHRSLAGQPIPVVIMDGPTPRIVTLGAPYRPSPPPPGSSWLIPEGRERAIERHLNEDSLVWGKWDLRVTQRGLGRQFIELTFIDDGYAGAAYDATASSITPRYGKSTGPGFAFIFGGTAVLINAILWTLAIGAVRLSTRRRQ